MNPNLDLLPLVEWANPCTHLAVAFPAHCGGTRARVVLLRVSVFYLRAFERSVGGRRFPL